MSVLSPQKKLVHEELLEQSKSWDENKKLQDSFADLFTSVKEDLVRFVAQSEAIKAMTEEQAQQVQSNYFKSMVASKIATSQEGRVDELSEMMNSVKEDLLREVAQRDSINAQAQEQERRLYIAAQKEINVEIERSVATSKVRRASELEQHQRTTIDQFHEIGFEIRKVVAQKNAVQAMDVEQTQRVTTDYFKRMVMGHLSKDQSVGNKESGLGAVHAELLKEVSKNE
eukprot:m.111673 g.111673  ORF g.111673 m.111673 type:complete len:228 (+) comp28137_c0_seq1:56-739(+)